jgi:hypothetical protein
MSKNKVSVSFYKHMDLYNLVKNKENSSSYICDLIKKDMETQCGDNDLEAKIEQALEKLLRGKLLSYNNSTNPPENGGYKPTSEDVDLIMNLF